MTNYISQELIEDVIEYTDPLKLIEKRITTISDINLIFSELEKIKTKKTQEILLSHLIQTYPDFKYFEVIESNKINENDRNINKLFQLRIDNCIEVIEFNFKSNIIDIITSRNRILAKIKIAEKYRYSYLHIKFIDNKYYLFYSADNYHISKVSEIKKINRF